MYTKNQLKHVVHNHGLWILAPTKSLKSSKVGAGMTLAGRPFQGRTVDGKKVFFVGVDEIYMY